MDSVFFWASKIMWALISPDSLLLILLLTAYFLLLLGWRRSGRTLLGACCLAALSVAVLPIADWLSYPLEKRFTPSPTLPNTLDGIIVLGGFIDTQGSDTWEQTQTNEAAERLLAFQNLARRYPEAKLVFTGGIGSLDRRSSTEADNIPPLMKSLGLAERDILLESQSRNTWENVVYSQQMLTPTPTQHWLLITSAAHMPRAVGIFCARQWSIIPYPVDFRSDHERMWRLEFRFAEHMLALRQASREWLGLLAYYMTGKTAQFLPSSASACVNTY